MKANIGVKLVVALALVAAPVARLRAQSLFATLTGVVSDPSGAVVAGATVKLIDEASSSARVTVTDSAGYYTFASVSVGNFTYKLTVEKQGFQMYEATGLTILGGEKRNVNVTMILGSTTQTVQVSGVASSIVPVDSGEKSETLTSQELQNYIQIGSDAAEYLKIMPGFAIQ
ncbi:MAG: carboxypeptidase-like regulatory domain-containing protein, partial [Terriglobia bacterium]